MPKFIEYVESTPGSSAKKLWLVNVDHVRKAVYREKDGTLTLHLCYPGEKPTTVDLNDDEAKAALAKLREVG